MTVENSPEYKAEVATKVGASYGALSDEERHSLAQFVDSMSLADTVTVTGVRPGEVVVLGADAEDSVREFDDVVVQVTYVINHLDFDDIDDIEELKALLDASRQPAGEGDAETGTCCKQCGCK